jgi:hypothetical protein
LVVPLSEKQQAALAKGRAALVAKATGPVSKESGDRGDAPLSKETGARDKGQPSTRRRVETVRVSKATKPQTKAKRSRSSPPAPSKESEPARKGLLERWLTET